MNYKVNEPYPNVQVTEKNIQYATMLLQEYSGKISENTVTHLYLYQSFILEHTYPQISQILKSIAITEMKHLSLLGQTILLLGVKPIFGSIDYGKINYWNGKEVDYSTSLKQILELDILAETEAIQYYQDSIQSILDPYIQQLLERILQDEILHLQIFQDLFSTYFPSTF